MIKDELFFELIRVAIGTQVSLTRQPSESEWDELYKMAKKQSLVGVCFAGAQKTLSNFPLKGENLSVIGVPKMLYLTWMGMAAKIQQRNQIVDEQCAALQKRLSMDGLRSCVLKGQGIATLYKCCGLKSTKSSSGFGLSDLRQSGDIDIWIEGGVEATVKLAKSLGQKADVTEQHVHLDIFENTEVEAHFIPSMLRNPIANARLQNWFKKMAPLQFANSNDDGLCVPTIEFNLVYLLIHIYRHLFAEGVGMRQVMDYYMVLRNVQEVSDVSKAQEVVKSLGLLKFTGGLMYVMHEVFGLERSMMLCEPNERHGRFLLNEIMLSGNMGHYDERTKNADRSTRWKRFWLMNKHNLRLISYYPGETLWAPFARIKVWAWRKWKGWI